MSVRTFVQRRQSKGAGFASESGLKSQLKIIAMCLSRTYGCGSLALSRTPEAQALICDVQEPHPYKVSSEDLEGWSRGCGRGPPDQIH